MVDKKIPGCGDRITVLCGLELLQDGLLHVAPAHGLATEVEDEVNLRPTVSRPVCLGVGHPSGTRDKFFFPFEIFFRQLRVYYFVAPSLTRGRVCNLLYNCFWALPEQSLLGQSSAELKAIFYSHLRLPQPGGPGPRIYIPQEQGGPVVPPDTGFPFCRLLRLSGLQWRYSIPPPHESSASNGILILSIVHMEPNSSVH
jgi:hypothetical protein